MSKKEILVIENLAAFEKIINRDKHPYDINMMVMPGTLEDKHKDVDPEKGIRALRRKFNLVYIILDGTHDVHLGADYRWLKPNDVVIVPENMVYASTNISNCKGYCIHFKTDFLDPVLQGSLTEQFPYFDLEAEHIFNVTPEESVSIQQAFKDIIMEFERFSPEQDSLLRSYIQILLLRIREIYRPYVSKVKANSTRAVKLANRYKHLLEKNFIEIREVQQYAEKMNISTRHLSDVVKETFGISPREMINNILFLEAKVLLGSTDKTITEIAGELNFEDQSHFSHFIKQRTGLTPVELRKNL